MDRKTAYRDKSCVAEMYRKQSKGSSSENFLESDLILGLILDSLVVNTDLEHLISAINVKESAPR